MCGVRNKEANTDTPGIQYGATKIMINKSLWWQRHTVLIEPPTLHGGTGRMDLDHSSGDGVHNITIELGMGFPCGIEERRLATVIQKRRRRIWRFEAAWKKS
jgi:hypothetical protein